MKTYLSHKNQLEGLSAVYDTVKTVEKIAASSIHFLKTDVRILQSYIGTLRNILVRLSRFYEPKRHSLLRTNAGGKKMLVVLTGEKGLVGALWHSVVNEALDKIDSYRTIVVVGGKGVGYLSEENIAIGRFFTLPYETLRQEEVKAINDYIVGEFNKKSVLQVDIVYPQFISLARQKPFLIRFLPFDLSLETGKNFQEKVVNPVLGLPIFEPSSKDIFSGLLKKYVDTFFYKLLLETKLSELAARTVTMEHASVKAEILKQKLKLEYFKERRRFMTQKQLENFVAHGIL